MFYQDKFQVEENLNEKKVSCFVYRSIHPNFPNHCHTHLELIYILYGNVKISLDGKSKVCRKGDLVFVSMLIPHSFCKCS